jgi:signal transduction histidine kinase
MRWSDKWRRRLRSLLGAWGALVAALLILAVGTGGSVVFDQWWNHTVTAQNGQRMDQSLAGRVTRITGNLTRYLDGLRAVGAFLQTGPGGAAGTQGRTQQFRTFIQAMDLPHRYTAMQALGWQIPDAPNRPPARPAGDAVLVYRYETEPGGPGTADDQRADSAVSAALGRSRDTGQPVMVPATAAAAPDHAVYWLVLPVYRTSTGAPDSAARTEARAVPARRAAMLGWVSARIRADRFLTEALSGVAPGNVGVQLRDDDHPTPIAADPDGFHPYGRYARTADLPVAGRMWRVQLAPLPGSVSIQDPEPAATIGLVGGILLAVLLAAMTVMISAQARTGRALRTANRRSTDMVAMLSHDARQPLTTIINYSQLVLEDWHDATATPAGTPQTTPAPEPGRRPPADYDVPASLERVIGAANRLNHLVDDVLATARLDAVPTHAARPVLITQTVAEAVSDSGASGMLIDTTAVQPVWAYGDPTHLRQITANLIGNALKYGAPPVTITATETGGQVTLEVSDAGPGVAAEFVDHLFDRFTQATTSLAAQGSGFGLYIVQRLAEVNGGHVSYQPGQPTGARFTVTLPAATHLPESVDETARSGT